jgi:hypothetical protein
MTTRATARREACRAEHRGRAEQAQCLEDFPSFDGFAHALSQTERGWISYVILLRRYDVNILFSTLLPTGDGALVAIVAVPRSDRADSLYAVGILVVT